MPSQFAKYILKLYIILILCHSHAATLQLCKISMIHWILQPTIWSGVHVIIIIIIIFELCVFDQINITIIFWPVMTIKMYWCHNMTTVLFIVPWTNIIVSPVRSTYGGYYGLVVVTPPRPRPQTLHRSRDNLSLSDCFHILYVDWYRWEDSWEARWAQSDYLWATQPPPPPPEYPKMPLCYCYKFVCSVMRSYCPEIFVHLGST